MKPYLTTGEAAELLGISRSTVSRKFDQGSLEGKKNPLTGERLISLKSVRELMERYDLPTKTDVAGRKTILVGTKDKRFLKSVEKALQSNGAVTIEHVPYGTDALVRCLREQIDLLIIDGELPDLPGAEVIKSLRRTQDAPTLKVLYRPSDQEHGTLQDLGADELLVKEERDEESLKAKVGTLLNLVEHGVADDAFPGADRRSSPRLRVNLPAIIEVFCREDAAARDSGRAVLKDISAGGARLEQMQVDGGRIPAGPFFMKLTVDDRQLKDWSAEAKVVRLQPDGSLVAGVRFTHLSDPNREKIESLLSDFQA